MKTRKVLGLALAVAMVALLTTPAFAETDAGAVPQDATATTDAGGSGDATSDVGADVGSDAVDAPDSSTGTTGPYTVNACWDEKCKAEIAACKGNKVCDQVAACVVSGKTPQACAEAAKATQADFDVFNKIQECGWKSCNDPNAGTCGAPGKGGAANRCGQFDNAWKCNCDDACTQYNDCCADKDKVCTGGGAAASCKDKCEAPFDSKAACQCDAECVDNGDCCEDYEKLCGGSTCTPACDGKQCGPDGCGGKCGTCPDGASCEAASGKCVAGGADAGTSGGSDAAGDGGAVATDGTGGGTDGTGGGTADAGVDAKGGGTVPVAAAPASSGCTAAPTGQGASSLLLALAALAGVLLLRRRLA